MLRGSSAVGKGDPSDTGMIRRWAGGIALAAAVSVAYFLAAQLSLRLLMQPDGVAVFWLSGGVTSGVLIALGPRARWPVAAGAVAGDLVPSLLSGWAAVAVGLCNAAEALIAAALIQYYFGTSFTLSRLRAVVGFLVAAVAATMISGIGGAIVYKLSSSPTASILTTWWHWFASDALGIISLAPLVIGVAAAMREPPPRRELIEGGAALALLAGMTGIIISLPHQPWESVVPSALLFPTLLWLAARCQPVFAAAGAFMVAFTVVWTTIFGIGHFGDPGLPIADRILEAQTVIMVVTVGSSVLAALFAERRQREADLVASEARLRMAQASTGVGIWDLDVRSGAISWTRELEEIYGLEAETAKHYSDFRDRVHPDDIENVEACRDAAIRKHERFRLEFRIIRPSGEVRWVASTGSASYDPITGEPIRILGNNFDITERKRAEEHQKTLMAELDHRVKNVLARVAMLVASTRKESTTIDKYVTSLQGRIQSMAVAHGLLSQGGWRNIGLGALVGKQLAPYARGSNVTIEGEDIELSPAETQAVAMVLHELVTNAAKFGSLSVPNGRVCVTWDRQNQDEAVKLVLQWSELDGPRVAVKVPSGYGTSLIRDLIPHELGGTVDLIFAPEGVSCKIEVLLERI